MKRIISVVIALSTGLSSSSAFAGDISASGVISSTAVGADFDYTITLTNTSTGPNADPISTFWFSWVPGKDFMNVAPSSVSTPTGWTDKVTHGGANDGYAIQFDATTAANDLAPGSEATFSFVSTLTPAELAGNSPFYSNEPELTSFVYSLGPLKGDGDGPFLVGISSVPEPSSWVLGIFGAIAASGYVRFRKCQRNQ